MQKKSKQLWITVLLLGWAFDLLFWEHEPGISFAIYVLITLIAGFFLLNSEGLRPARNAVWLLVPVLFFALTTALRREPMTVFLAHGFALFLMAVLASTYLGGRWPEYGLVDYLARLFQLGLSMVAQPVAYMVETRRLEAEAGEQKSGQKVWPVVRGVLLAIPVVALFAALLSSADLVFAQRLENLIELFRLERLPEYIFRLVLIVVVAAALAGVYLHAARKSREETLIGKDKAIVPTFFGFTEASIVLGSVVVLFALFVGIQFQYFFGGEANITQAGFTYSEYARRGFGELVAVALISLALFLGLSAVVKRESARQHNLFSGLGVAQMLLVVVMLVSAFQRLLLYESAYGFTRLRAYTHVFMIWLGVLLAVVVVLDLLKRQRTIALAALLASVGFAATLALMNVDGFIVRQNVQRAEASEALDTAYLATLSHDSVPALVDLYLSSGTSENVQNQVGAVLACRKALASSIRRPSDDWQSFTFSRLSADRAGARVENATAAYQVELNEYDVPLEVIDPQGTAHACLE